MTAGAALHPGALNAALERLRGAVIDREQAMNRRAWAERSRTALLRQYGDSPLDPGQAAVLADLDRRIAQETSRA